ncbi:MAG: hypothetical protein FIA94_05705 [Nitrospirae bacterium]|nr:hypothetical protein [Nitrospirota bacterium]
MAFLMNSWFGSMFCFALVLLLPVSSWAHGFAGKRFFPTTLSVEDPFVSDELSFVFGHIKEAGTGGEPSVKTTSFGVEYSKRITPRFGISIGDEYQHLSFADDGTEDGFGNLELGLKYQFYTNEAHEMILSIGTGIEIGGTGSSRIGAESFSVVSPALFFGKGLGDLPDSLKYLRPLAVTGVVGPNMPTRAKNVTYNEEGEKETERNPNTLTWAFTVQYSLMYLQSFVKDIGLGTPLNRMILLVEFPMETCLDRGCKGQTTGMVNPGVVWIGKYMEWGVAAQIPINRESGRNVGVLGLLHFFIDDLFPKSIGRPIFP